MLPVQPRVGSERVCSRLETSPPSTGSHKLFSDGFSSMASAAGLVASVASALCFFLDALVSSIHFMAAAVASSSNLRCPLHGGMQLVATGSGEHGCEALTTLAALW